MRDPITAGRFQEADGVDDWRAVGSSASTVYRTTSFTEGAEFALDVARVADAMDHHPDVDLRPRRVVLRTSTHSADSLTELDVELARRIQVLARERGLVVRPPG